MTSEILAGKLLWYFTISFVYSLPYFLYSNFFFDMNDTDCILSYFREYSIFNIHPEHCLWKKNVISQFSNLHLCKLLSLTWHIHTLLIFYANLSSFPFISHFRFFLHTFTTRYRVHYWSDSEMNIGHAFRNTRLWNVCGQFPNLTYTKKI